MFCIIWKLSCFIVATHLDTHHACGKKHKGKVPGGYLFLRYLSDIPKVLPKYFPSSKFLPNGSAAIATGEADAYLHSSFSYDGGGHEPGVTRAAADDVIFKMFYNEQN